MKRKQQRISLAIQQMSRTLKLILKESPQLQIDYDAIHKEAKDDIEALEHDIETLTEGKSPDDEFPYFEDTISAYTKPANEIALSQ